MKILVLLSVFFLLAPVAPFASDEEEDEKVADCCFQHSSHQGTCTVTPGEGETCQTILEYLNTPNTVGKNYCGGTRVRGGWMPVDCPAPESESGEGSR